MATLEFPVSVYKYLYISVFYQLTFAFTGYYVYLSGELEMNSLLLKIVYRDEGNVAHNCHG